MTDTKIYELVPGPRHPNPELFMQGQLASARNIYSQMSRIPSEEIRDSIGSYIHAMRATLQGMKEGAA